MVVSLKEVNMTFRKIKFLLGLTKRIAFVKKRNGDYLVYDNEKNLLKTTYLYSEFDENLFIINMPIEIKTQKRKLKLGDKPGALHFSEYYVGTIFSTPLGKPIDFFDKNDIEAFYVADAYLNQYLNKSHGGFIVDGVTIKKLVKKYKNSKK